MSPYACYHQRVIKVPATNKKIRKHLQSERKMETLRGIIPSVPTETVEFTKACPQKWKCDKCGVITVTLWRSSSLPTTNGHSNGSLSSPLIPYCAHRFCGQCLETIFIGVANVGKCPLDTVTIYKKQVTYFVVIDDLDIDALVRFVIGCHEQCCLLFVCFVSKTTIRVSKKTIWSFHSFLSLFVCLQMIESVAKVDNILSQEVYCSQKSRGCRKTMFLSELEVCVAGEMYLHSHFKHWHLLTILSPFAVASQILSVRSSPLSTKVRSRCHYKITAKSYGHRVSTPGDQLRVL